MTTPEVKSIDKEKIKDILNDKKGKMKLSLFVCAHCGLCAESCPLYRAHDRNPEYMPSYKEKLRALWSLLLPAGN